MPCPVLYSTLCSRLHRTACIVLQFYIPSRFKTRRPGFEGKTGGKSVFPKSAQGGEFPQRRTSTRGSPAALQAAGARIGIKLLFRLPSYYIQINGPESHFDIICSAVSQVRDRPSRASVSFVASRPPASHISPALCNSRLVPCCSVLPPIPRTVPPPRARVLPLLPVPWCLLPGRDCLTWTLHGSLGSRTQSSRSRARPHNRKPFASTCRPDCSILAPRCSPPPTGRSVHTWSPRSRSIPPPDTPTR